MTADALARRTGRLAARRAAQRAVRQRRAEHRREMKEWKRRTQSIRKYMDLDMIAYELKLNKDASIAMDSVSTPMIVPLKNRSDYDIGLLLDDDMREDIEARRLARTDGEIELYSDGSLVDMGTEQISMAFGVVLKDGDRYRDVISGRTGGFASSTKAELIGLLAAIMVSPREQEVTVRIDNAAVISNSKTLVKHRDTATARQRNRAVYARWWGVIADEYEKQGKRIKVAWIKGHDGNPGNEAADRLAKAAHQSQHKWRFNTLGFINMRCHATLRGYYVEDDLRRVMKAQFVARVHQAWSEQNRTKEHIGDWQQ
ncbi:hypothetical protein BGZ51_006329, partial [Haplosporangium sp. Z 767]